MILFFFLLILSTWSHSSSNQLKVTYVSGLWNLARGDMVFYKRNFDYYLNFLQDILEAQINVIMFGNAQVRTFVEKHKKYSDRIHFVQLSLEDMAKYWYTQKIGERIDAVKKDWVKWQRYSILPQYGLRMYNPVVLSKLKIIMEAAKIDPFESDYLVWIDGAITHSVDKKFIQDNTLARFFRNHQTDWVIQVGQGLPFHPFEVGFKDQGRTYANISTRERLFVWANWLGGKSAAASTAYHIFQNFLRYTLENGDMNTDEAIFFLMLERYSYLFHRGVTPLSCNLTLSIPIVEDSYALREIKAKDVIHHASLIGYATPSPQGQALRSIHHFRNDHAYFKMIERTNKHSLTLRVTIFVALIVLLTYFRIVSKKKPIQYIIVNSQDLDSIILACQNC